jgi:hypothetical protein
MFGILAIDLRGLHVALCVGGDGADVLMRYPSRETATEEAASLSAWYQKDIRPNVVYMCVPLPMIGNMC